MPISDHSKTIKSNLVSLTTVIITTATTHPTLPSSLRNLRKTLLGRISISSSESSPSSSSISKSTSIGHSYIISCSIFTSAPFSSSICIISRLCREEAARKVSPCGRAGKLTLICSSSIMVRSQNTTLILFSFFLSRSVSKKEHSSTRMAFSFWVNLDVSSARCFKLS